MCDNVLVLGHQYQGFDVRYNYIAFNDAEYRNIIAAFGIQLNFTTNIVFANRAQCIVNASVLEKVVADVFLHSGSVVKALDFDPTNAPCGLLGCNNRPALFHGRVS